MMYFLLFFTITEFPAAVETEIKRNISTKLRDAPASASIILYSFLYYYFIVNSSVTYSIYYIYLLIIL